MKNAQRILDILFAGIALIILAPLFIPLAIILRLTGEGEIFYSQERVGQGGQMFRLHKFATMLKNSPSLGTGTITVRNDPRVLPFGKILRKTKINELPQLLNVLSGDMSLVGPRPQTRRCFDAFPAPAQQAIIQVRPGLTGIGSLYFRHEQEMMNGAQNPDALYNNAIMPYKGELEIWYVRHVGLTAYFKLLFLTVAILAGASDSIVSSAFGDLPVPDRDFQALVRA